jgi:hypothetical protein
LLGVHCGSASPAGFVGNPPVFTKEIAMNTSMFGADLPALLKYPRTPHLEGSRLQDGDEGYEHVPYNCLAGRYIVIEEKLDGGNSGVSYDGAGEQLLQSRGHYLVGGGRERQFNLFKRWASAHESALLECLEDRYVMYGEWLHKKHSVFYDSLPHYFAEFDIWDRSREVFLSTEARAQVLAGAPVLAVPVLYAGIAPKTLREMQNLIQTLWAARLSEQKGLSMAAALHTATPPTTLDELQRLVQSLMAAKPKYNAKAWLPTSLGKSANWRENFEKVIAKEQLDLTQAWKQTDKSDLSEGLYIKVEENGQTLERYKWVRADFVQAILDSNKHHAEQPFVPNQLRTGVDIFAPQLTHSWESKREGV